ALLLGLVAASPAGAGHTGAPAVATLTAEHLKRLLDGREPVVLVDVRKPAEYRAGHLPHARSLPITELDRRVREIPTADRVVLYCDCPPEEIATAYVFLQAQGYRNTLVLEDGFGGWLRQRYPVIK